MRHIILIFSVAVFACGTSETENSASSLEPERTQTSTATVDQACESARKRTIECGAKDAHAGDEECREVRCAWTNYRDAAFLSEKMANRKCSQDMDTFVEASRVTHANEPGVRTFVDACEAKAKKNISEGGCHDPRQPPAFYGVCELYAVMNDAARARFDACLKEPTCRAFNDCYAAIFASCI